MCKEQEQKNKQEKKNRWHEILSALHALTRVRLTSEELTCPWGEPVCAHHTDQTAAAAAAAITGSLPGPELQTLSAGLCGLQSVTLFPSSSINNITERLAERRAAAEALWDCAAAN